MDKTKDIQYFLNAEKEFCKEHPDYGTLYFDEKYGMGKVGDNDQASFLIHRPFEENFEKFFNKCLDVCKNIHNVPNYRNHAIISMESTLTT